MLWILLFYMDLVKCPSSFGYETKASLLGSYRFSKFQGRLSVPKQSVKKQREIFLFVSYFFCELLDDRLLDNFSIRCELFTVTSAVKAVQ